MIARAIALVLLNAVSEPIAIAACAFAVLRIARKASAATRCAVLTTAVTAALLLPVITTVIVYRDPPANTVTSRSSTAPLEKPVRVILPSAKEHAVPSIALPPVQRPTVTLPAQIVLAGVGAWAAVAMLLLLRLLIGFAHLRRLRSNALPLSPEIRTQLWRSSEKAAGIDVRLCLSDLTAVPIAVGLFDCMVLIPRRLVEELEPADLDRIVLHEIAHLRRHDGVVHAVQQLANALYFFSPGVLWLSRMLDVEREVACDDWVLERGGDAAPYANCLVRLAEGVPWPHKPLAAPGAFVTRHSMSIRIERILQQARDARLHAAPLPVAACIAAAGIVAAVGLSFAPSLAYPVVAVVRASTPVKSAKSIAVKVHSPKHTVVKHVALSTAAPKAAAARPVVQNPVTHKFVAPKPVRQTRLARSQEAVKPQIVALATPTAAASGDYIDEMRAVFGERLSVEDLVSLKSLRVTPQYAQQLRSAGFPDLNVRGVMAARASGITPERVAQYRADFGSISFDDMIAMASMHVDTAYQAQMEAAGLKDLNARQLIELRSVGVTPAYIKQLAESGFGTLSSEQLLQLRSMNIDKAFLDRVRARGFQNLSIEQLVELKASGVIK
ncbi:MAG: M56 family metallopeptidase [Candidatus Baltobacteraceae bacterium]